MSRIDNKHAEQASLQQAQQARSEQAKQQSSASKKKFGSALHEAQQKTGQQKKAEAKDAKQPQAQESAKQESLLKRQGQPVMSRGRGGNTVADLQARLQQPKGKKGGMQQGKLEGMEGGMQGKGGLQGMGGKGEDALSIDARGGRGGSGGSMQGGSRQDGDSLQGQEGLTAFQTGNDALQRPLDISKPVEVQVSGNRIPNSMLDKMVENARVGVNASGAAEMQFDLKGDVLGGLKMRMSMEDGQLKAIFIASNPDVKKFLDANMKDLERALEDRGLQVRDLEVRDPEEQRRQQQKDQQQKERREAFEQD